MTSNKGASMGIVDHKRGGLRVTTAALALVCLAAVCGWTGCQEPDWNDVNYIKTQLEEGNRLKAFDEMVKLPDEKKRELVPTLVKLYDEDKDKTKAYAQLALLRDPRAKEVYIDALKNAASNQDKRAAAIALGDIKATDHIPDLIQTFKSVPNEDLRRAVLEAFKAMPDPAELPLLVEILNTYDPDRESIAYHAYACEIIAEVGQATETVVDAVVYGMFLDNAKGQNVANECSVAVFSTGSAATDKLISILQGKHERINARFARYPTYIDGFNEIKAADRLGMLHDPAAIDALLAEMTRTREMPPTYRDQKALQWGSNRLQLFVYIASALGDLKAPNLGETMKPYIFADEKALEPYKTMVDYDKRAKYQIAVGAMDAINRSGDRAGLSVLSEAIQKANFPELKGFGDEAVYQTRWEAAHRYAKLASGAELGAWDKLMENEKEPRVKEEMTKYKPMIVVAQECKDQAPCYGRHLVAKDPIKAEKAAWELGRLAKGGVVETELAKGLKVTNKVVREASILSMFRVGTKASIPAVDEAIKDTSDKDVKLKLNALKYYLKTRG